MPREKPKYIEGLEFVHKIVAREPADMVRDGMSHWERVTLDCGHSFHVPEDRRSDPATAYRCMLCVQLVTGSNTRYF